MALPTALPCGVVHGALEQVASPREILRRIRHGVQRTVHRPDNLLRGEIEGRNHGMARPGAAPVQWPRRVAKWCRHFSLRPEGHPYRLRLLGTRERAVRAPFSRSFRRREVNCGK